MTATAVEHFGDDWTLDDGIWRKPVGDGTVEVELYDDEMSTFPPLVTLVNDMEELANTHMETLATLEDVTLQRDTLLAAITEHRDTYSGPMSVAPAKAKRLWDVIEGMS